MLKRSWLLLPLLLLAGCSSSSGDPTAESPPAAPEVAEDAGSASAEPLTPYGDAPKTTSESASSMAYISRAAMSNTSIDMRWSSYDDAAEYRIHRLARTSDQRPELEAMTAENEVHIATATNAFVDDGVETGTRYWYGVRVLAADGALVAHGWHPADAITDEEPPTPVGGLEAVVKDGEVLLSWDEPDENYQLHSYQVLRGVDGAEPEGVSATWNLEQRTFIDDDPPSGTVTYQITSHDFHWNVSEPSEITVDIPG